MVTDARWFFQEHAGVYQAVPQTPRGWYVASGYAAQRSDDLSSGTSPGYSTTESQQLDAAALYFVETYFGANVPGRGGFIIEFQPVPGWLLPTNQVVGVAVNQETILDANYI